MMTDPKTSAAISNGSFDEIGNKIRFIIRHYKEHFAEIDRQEHYKRKSIDWYRQKWDLRVCFKTIKVTKPRYRQVKQQHENIRPSFHTG